MTRTARNRLFLALALGVAATFPRSLHPRPLSLGDAVAHAEFNRVNRNVSNELSPKNYKQVKNRQLIKEHFLNYMLMLVIMS